MADAVDKIPLISQNQDRLIWHFDSKSLFMVKSAYIVLVASPRVTSQPLNIPMEEDLAPKHPYPRIMHFIWRTVKTLSMQEEILLKERLTLTPHARLALVKSNMSFIASSIVHRWLWCGLGPPFLENES